MSNDRKRNGNTAEADDSFTESFSHILAGYEKNLEGLDIFGLSIQRIRSGDYRVVLRGEDWRDPENRVRVVSFTNASTPFLCLYELNEGLRRGTIKFVLDKYATSNVDDGAAKTKRVGFRLID